MSHLNTYIARTTDFKYSYGYNPKEYRKFLVRKSFWFALMMVSLLSWVYVVMTISQDNLLGLATSMMLVIGIFMFVKEIHKAQSRFYPLSQLRKETREAYRFAHHQATVENLTWPESASYFIDAKIVDSATKQIRLMIEPYNSLLLPSWYDIWPNRVETIVGPDFREIFPEIKNMIATSSDHAAFIQSDRFIELTFGLADPREAKGPGAAGGQAPLTGDTPWSIRGD